MDIATKCQTHSAIKSHSKKEYIVRLLFNEKGSEIGRKPWVLKTVEEVVRCKDCKWYGHPGCAIRIVDDSDKPNDNDFCSFGERSDNANTD